MTSPQPDRPRRFAVHFSSALVVFRPALPVVTGVSVKPNPPPA
jgi:hypothetical protein